MIKTIHAKVKLKQEGQYSIYVFEDLEQPLDSIDKYLMVVRLPNWTGRIPNLDEIGYLQFQIVNSGDEYYNRHNQNIDVYNYTNNYFISFLPELNKIDIKEFKF